MCEAQNAVNPKGFTSILTKLQRKILVSKSDSNLNTLASYIPPITRGTFVSTTCGEYSDLLCLEFGFQEDYAFPQKAVT